MVFDVAGFAIRDGPVLIIFTTQQRFGNGKIRYNPFYMRKFIAALVLLLGVLFLLTRFAELHEVLDVLKRGHLVYLGLALGVEMAWIVNLSAFYQSVYHVFGMEEKRAHMMKLVTAAYFLTVVAPSAGLSAMAVYLADAQHRGRSVAKVTVAAVLYVWFEYIGTLSILILGLAELARRNNLHWSEITASLILLAGGLGISLLIYMGMKSAQALGKTLAWMARAVNRVVRPFTHREYLPVARAYTFSAEVSDGISVLRHNPRWVIWPLIYTWANKALLLLILAMCFMAFNVPLHLGTLVAGLSIAQLFLIVSPTPAGIGIVEGILAVSLKTLGLPLSDATVVAISYRGFSFWTPLLVGMFTFRILSRVQKRPIALTIEEVNAVISSDTEPVRPIILPERLESGRLERDRLSDRLARSQAPTRPLSASDK